MSAKKLPRKKNFSTLKMLGAQVQTARKAAGYTQRELAALLMVDDESIASIEQGRRPLMPDLAVQMDELLELKGTLSAGVDKLPEIDQFPMHAQQYMLHEREALSLSLYDALVVPGILQTEPYARAVFSSRVPAFSEDEIATKTAARIARQTIIHRPDPPTLSLVIWEPAVLYPLGGDEVHREQLQSLRDSAEIPGITLQILPLHRNTHAGLSGAFTLMETPDHQHLAYTQAHHGSQLVADPEWVSILTRKYAMLRSQALTPEGSADLLDRLLGVK
ncbi:DNA-binding protein [Streptomyces sp. Tu 6176]|uniref:helix-turn-helix domain-containing protein n=1 Tax=Streptomyces sp. Tu 6176 TaxID=1470557 RepID=UPI00044C5E1E|nr:helix-turn-helix transcriptional regulator [Streptomyces sp. Tu 6176]EYT84677.1 DNA-binding protein [Streptomyces sp. Tu 6176]